MHVVLARIVLILMALVLSIIHIDSSCVVLISLVGLLRYKTGVDLVRVCQVLLLVPSNDFLAMVTYINSLPIIYIKGIRQKFLAAPNSLLRGQLL